MQEESSFCEQKEAKKLCQLEPVNGFCAPIDQKFFASFFQKRCFFLHRSF